MADDTESKQDKYSARLTEAVEHIRSNVKWTLVAFGAIGTTLLAGSQLSNLGRFYYSDWRLWLSLLFALLALGAAAYAVRSALKVVFIGYVELNSLELSDIAYIERNHALLDGFESVEVLRQAYHECIQTKHTHLAEQADLKVLETDKSTFLYLDALIDDVLSAIRYNRIREQSERSQRSLMAASIIAAIGLVGFAWAANPGKDESTVVLRSPPSPAKLSLTTSGKATLLPVLGEKCAAHESIDVILISITTSNAEVVTQAIDGCPMLRITLTPGMGKLTSADGAAGAALPAGAAAANDRPIIWTQLRPDTDSAKSEQIARAIVARDAPCPALTVNGARWPMETRSDGADPDFPIRMCEATLPGDAKAQLGDVMLKPRPHAPHKIVVIGDTGCRITDYTSQPCDRGNEWPFFRIAQAASAMHPDLVIHVGDYHYREKPCAGRAGCSNSPYGDNWRTWNAEFFVPAAPLLTAAPWLMVRGNHEDCPRAGAGWNLLIRPRLGLKPGEGCPPDADPDVFSFDRLHLVVPDTASADAHGREDRVVTYRQQIRELAKTLKDKPGDSWLVTHQALWVSYAQKNDKTYAEADLYSRAAAKADPNIRADLCGQIISPMNTFRQWIGGKVPLANPNESNPPDKRKERPCAETAPPAQTVAAPHFSLVLSGDTHTFQMFNPGDAAPKDVPVQLVVGNSGDALESDKAYPEAEKKLIDADATLFGVTGKLWMRNTFGFAVLDDAGGTKPWTATLYDVDGKPIAHCSLARSGDGCK